MLPHHQGEWIERAHGWGTETFHVFVNAERVAQWREVNDLDLSFDVDKMPEGNWIVALPKAALKSGNCEPCVMCRRLMTYNRMQGCCERHSVHVDCFAITHMFKSPPCVAGMYDACITDDNLISLSIDEVGLCHAALVFKLRNEPKALAMMSKIRNYRSWMRPVTTVYPLAPRRAGEGTCVMCDHRVMAGTGLDTCDDHVTHMHCYAVWRTVRDALGGSAAFGRCECPAKAFGVCVECTHSLLLL